MALVAVLLAACGDDDAGGGLSLRVEPGEGACDAMVLVEGQGFAALADQEGQVLIRAYAGDLDGPPPDRPIETFAIADVGEDGRFRADVDLATADTLCSGRHTAVTIVAADGGPGALTHYRLR